MTTMRDLHAAHLLGESDHGSCMEPRIDADGIRDTNLWPLLGVRAQKVIESYARGWETAERRAEQRRRLDWLNEAVEELERRAAHADGGGDFKRWRVLMDLADKRREQATELEASMQRECQP